MHSKRQIRPQDGINGFAGTTTFPKQRKALKTPENNLPCKPLSMVLTAISALFYSIFFEIVQGFRIQKKMSERFFLIAGSEIADPEKRGKQNFVTFAGID